jgi:hypothetical protein
LNERIPAAMRSDGESAVAIADQLSEMNIPRMISLLLAAGADPSLRTPNGETITEFGRRSKDPAIRQLF